jgi:hypothetical protein
MKPQQQQIEGDRIIQYDEPPSQYDANQAGEPPANYDERATEHDERAARHDELASHPGLLNDPAGLREEWQRVQGTFVDDPKSAVHEASLLVERTLREIQTNVTRGPVDDVVSTEDLRVSFQHYREFFQRLLSA